MLRKTIKTTKRVPVEVVSFKWLDPISEKLGTLRCSACRNQIGERKWGLAWIKDEKGKRAMRLCDKCGETAEQAIKEKPND